MITPLTERSLVRTVAARWRTQHAKAVYLNTKKRAIQQALEQIDPETATNAEVTQIIGNDTWTGPQLCEECREYCPRAVEFEGLDSIVRICRDCLAKAIATLDATP